MLCVASAPISLAIFASLSSTGLSVRSRVYMQVRGNTIHRLSFFGQYVEQLLLRRDDLSIVDLAAHLGISRQALLRFRSGNHNARQRTMARIRDRMEELEQRKIGIEELFEFPRSSARNSR